MSLGWHPSLVMVIVVCLFLLSSYLKSIGGAGICVLGGSRTYPGPRPQFPGAEPGRTARYSVTVTVISL